MAFFCSTDVPYGVQFPEERKTKVLRTDSAQSSVVDTEESRHNHNKMTNWFLLHCESRPGRSIVRNKSVYFLTIDLPGRETQCKRNQLVLWMWLFLEDEVYHMETPPQASKFANVVRAGIEHTAAAPSQPAHLDVSRSDNPAYISPFYTKLFLFRRFSPAFLLL